MTFGDDKNELRVRLFPDVARITHRSKILLKYMDGYICDGIFKRKNSRTQAGFPIL